MKKASRSSSKNQCDIADECTENETPGDCNKSDASKLHRSFKRAVAYAVIVVAVVVAIIVVIAVFL